MTIRRFNYTDRKRIARSSIRCRLRRLNGALHFDADLDLSDHHFDPGALVWLEAERGIERERFSWGTVDSLRPPHSRSLARFTSDEGISFRLIVTAGPAAQFPGIILGEASNIRPDLSDAPSTGGRSLLPVAVDDQLGQRVWHLDFELQGPVLKVNPDVGGKSWAAGGEFRAIVLPSCIRIVLLHILLGDMPEWPIAQPNDSDWRSLWLWWASGLPSMPEVPEERDSFAAAAEWTDEVVERFVEQIRARDLMVARRAELSV